MNSSLQKAWDIKIENLSSGYKDVTVIKSMNAHIPAQKSRLFWVNQAAAKQRS